MDFSGTTSKKAAVVSLSNPGSIHLEADGDATCTKVRETSSASK